MGQMYVYRNVSNWCLAEVLPSCVFVHSDLFILRQFLVNY